MRFRPGVMFAVWILLTGVAWPWAALAAPPSPNPEIAELIGDYGPTERLVAVFERDGILFADAPGVPLLPLSRLDVGRYAAQPAVPGRSPAVLIFSRPHGARPSELRLDGESLQRRDIGAEVVAAIQAGVRADPARLRAQALAASPPMEPQPRRMTDLVNLALVDPTIRFDIRYATSNNFMGFALYERPAAYLQRPAAEALGRVQTALKDKGFGLLVHDAYRPWSVTRIFWDATPPDSRAFVADPAKGSRHNRGCAVDVTLIDLATGAPVEMTSLYDEMSRRSFADYRGGTSRQRWLRDLLRTEMEREGFQVLAEEWWHFDYRDWRDYAIGTATLSDLARIEGP